MSRAIVLAPAKGPAAGRSCGSCSMCCYISPYPGPELSKPPDTWCAHCRPGHGGCSIYDKRPEGCRKFVCSWLANPELFGDEWYPKRSRLVCSFVQQNGKFWMRIEVDKRYPTRWSEEPYYTQICELALEGLKSQKFATIVRVGDDRFLVLGRRIIKNPSSKGRVVQTAPDVFDWVEAASNI